MFPPTRAFSADPLPTLHEVVELLRAHADQYSEAELDQAAVNGVIEHLGGKVRLLDKNGETKDALTKASVYADSYLDLQVKQVTHGLADAVAQSIQAHRESGKITGLILDLRFANGQDYSEAVSVVDLFSKNGLPLLEINGEMKSTQSGGPVISLPIVVLINKRTNQAAEALAAALREASVAILVGSNTAGQAFTYREYELSDGRRLQIAGGRLKLGDETLLTDSGVSPDIQVVVSEENEKQWQDDPYLRLNGEDDSEGRLTEAELVRRHNELLGMNEQLGIETPAAALPAEEKRQEVKSLRDPSLARAVDLLKGLVLLKHLRQP